MVLFTTQGGRWLARCGGALLMLTAILAAPAQAQRLVATVNDAPITNYDVGQRMKLLRALRMKSSPATAMESLIEDRLKASEAKKYSIKPNDQQIIQYAVREAQKRKIPQQQIAHSLQRGGIDEAHWKEYFSNHLAWDTLIGALYKSVNVGVGEINSELAKRGKTTNRTEYQLRQITLIVPQSAGAGGFQARMREASGLRSRFTNCQQGIALARALRDVAVQGIVTRSAADLDEKIVKLFENTPVGRTTPPSRGATGVELIAVCGKKNLSGQVAAGSSIREELLAKKLEIHSARRYQEIRKTAVIVRR